MAKTEASLFASSKFLTLPTIPMSNSRNIDGRRKARLDKPRKKANPKAPRPLQAHPWVLFTLFLALNSWMSWFSKPLESGSWWIAFGLLLLLFAWAVPNPDPARRAPLWEAELFPVGPWM